MQYINLLLKSQIDLIFINFFRQVKGKEKVNKI